MNKERRKVLLEGFSTLKGAVEEERETLDNQEESFGETQKWQEADEICQLAEYSLEQLEVVLDQWGVM